MSQPSEEALRAADAFMKWNGETSVPKYMLEARDRLARIIDQETNLPALKAVLEQAKAFCACANEVGPWGAQEIEGMKYLREAIVRAERKEL